MSDPHVPPLSADISELIAGEWHEIDTRYWKLLLALRVSMFNRMDEYLHGKPFPPQQPIAVTNILRDYSRELFYSAANKYPTGPELNARVSELRQQIVEKIVKVTGPNLRGTLTYHASIEDVTKAILLELNSDIQSYLRSRVLPSSPQVL